MSELNLGAYALVVGEEHAATFFYPLDMDETCVMLTAALQSDPTIVFDPTAGNPNINRYSVFVGEDYVGKLYQRTEPVEYFGPINAALQSSPKVIWIQTDYPVVSSMTWRYENGTFIKNEG